MLQAKYCNVDSMQATRVRQKYIHITSTTSLINECKKNNLNRNSNPCWFFLYKF